MHLPLALHLKSESGHGKSQFCSSDLSLKLFNYSYTNDLLDFLEKNMKITRNHLQFKEIQMRMLQNILKLQNTHQLHHKWWPMEYNCCFYIGRFQLYNV